MTYCGHLYVLTTEIVVVKGRHRICLATIANYRVKPMDVVGLVELLFNNHSKSNLIGKGQGQSVRKLRQSDKPSGDKNAGSRSQSKQGMSNFLVRNSREIQNILRRLVKNSATITVSSENNKDFILTTIISIQQKHGLLILEEGSNVRLNSRLLNSPEITCESELQHVKIRFDSNSLSRARFKGEGVLVCPIPDSLFYLEHRQSFRVSTPITNPPHCSLQLINGERVGFSVVDLSAYGLGMDNPLSQLDLQKQESLQYTNCGLLLPDFGETVVDLQLRNFRHVILKNGKEVQRVGAIFVHLSPGTEKLIQRYVNQLQIKQIAINKSD